MQTKIIDQWVEAVNTGNLEQVLDFYAENSVLIPTFSDRLSDTKEKIRAYFEALVAKKNLSVEIHARTVKEQALTNGLIVYSGIYCWKFEVDGELISNEARFSFVIETIPGTSDPASPFLANPAHALTNEVGGRSIYVRLRSTLKPGGLQSPRRGRGRARPAGGRSSAASSAGRRADRAPGSRRGRQNQASRG